MSNFLENSSRPFYPSRPSETDFASFKLNEIEPIKLSEEEKLKLVEYENNLASKFKEILDIKVASHTFYTNVFKTKEGSNLLEITYCEKDKKRIRPLAEKYGINIEKGDSDNVTALNDAYFEDLLLIASDQDLKDKYKTEEIIFPNLSKEVNKLAPSNTPIEVKFKADIDLNLKEKILASQTIPLDVLNEQSKTQRTRLSQFTSTKAEELFLQQYREHKGDVEFIQSPNRTTVLLEPDDLLTKIIKLNILKKSIQISNSKKEDTTTQDLINKYYTKQINANLALLYFDAQAITKDDVKIFVEKKLNKKEIESENQEIDEVEEYIKNNFSGQNDSSTKIIPTRLLDGHNARNLERLDRFVRGISRDSEGKVTSLPEKLKELVDSANTIEKNEITEKYDSIKFNSEHVKQIAQQILNIYGFNNIKLVSTKKNVLSVTSSSVNIPKDYNKGLLSTLSVLSHEIEGHVLRNINRKNIKESSKENEFAFFNESRGVRSDFFSEAAAMEIELQTYFELSNIRSLPSPYYYLALEAKQNGGDFKECFNVFLRAVAKRKYPDLSFAEILKDDEKYKEITDYSYRRTLRIFRRDTPLDISEPHITTTDELAYLEQSITIDNLHSNDIGEILYMSGLDLDNIELLIKLGIIDLKKINKPKYVTARIIWPKIKDAIDNNPDLSIEQIIKNTFSNEGEIKS